MVRKITEGIGAGFKRLVVGRSEKKKKSSTQYVIIKGKAYPVGVKSKTKQPRGARTTTRRAERRYSNIKEQLIRPPSDGSANMKGSPTIFQDDSWGFGGGEYYPVTSSKRNRRI